MRTVLKIIDSINEYTGRVVGWLGVILVLILSYEVIMRYVFNAPTIWTFETANSMFLALVALGWGYTHLHQGHVRIDVLYTRFSPRLKALVDVVIAPTFFIPLGIFTYIAFSKMWYSWSTGEVLAETFWYPPAAPVRAALFLGLCLFILQGVAVFTRDLYFLIRNKPL